MLEPTYDARDIVGLDGPVHGMIGRVTAPAHVCARKLSAGGRAEDRLLERVVDQGGGCAAHGCDALAMLVPAAELFTMLRWWPRVPDSTRSVARWSCVSFHGKEGGSSGSRTDSDCWGQQWYGSAWRERRKRPVPARAQFHDWWFCSRNGGLDGVDSRVMDGLSLRKRPEVREGEESESRKDGCRSMAVIGRRGQSKANWGARLRQINFVARLCPE